MSRVSNPAGSWLAGAQTGLQLRAQDIGVDQYDHRMAQDQSQHEDNLALAAERHGLDAEWNAHRIAEAEQEWERSKQRARVKADWARSYLTPRGGLPGMTPHGPVFSPPGMDDDFHAILDEAGDDPDLIDKATEIVIKGEEGRQQFRTMLGTMESRGDDKFVSQHDPLKPLFEAAKKKQDPRTLDIVMNMVDQQKEQEKAIAIGAGLGLSPEESVAHGSQKLAAEAVRRQRETGEATAKSVESEALAQSLVRTDGISIEVARDRVAQIRGGVKNEMRNLTGQTNVTKTMIEADPEYRTAERRVTKAEKRLDTISKLPRTKSGDPDLVAAQKEYDAAIDEQETAYRAVHARLGGQPASGSKSEAAAPQAAKDPLTKRMESELGPNPTDAEIEAWLDQNGE